MTDSFDAMFSDLIAQTQRAADGLGPDAEQLDEMDEVVGHAADERVAVYMKAGKVTRVELQPPVRKLELHELGDELVVAINAAIEANLASVMSLQQDQPDFESLTGQLHSIQTESIRQLEKYTQGMYEMLKNAKEMGKHG